MQNSQHPFAHDVQSFARTFKISRSKIYEEIAAGRIAIVKIGRSTRILHEEGERYFRSLQRRIAA